MLCEADTAVVGIGHASARLTHYVLRRRDWVWWRWPDGRQNFDICLSCHAHHLCRAYRIRPPTF